MTKKGKPEVKRDGGAHPQQLLSGSLDAKLDNRQKVCSHYTYEGKVHLKQMLLSIVAYTHCLPCQICPKDSIVKNEDLENLKNGGGQQLHKKKNKTKKGSGTRKVQANVAKIDIWVCLTCAGHFCAAAGDIRADSHARGHAMQTEHWWAVKYVDPTTVYCFKCALVVPVNMGIIADEEAETATPDAYFVIQGLSSLGTVSCFNALLQNLLALTPLREEMLRLDFPRKAHICVALKKLIKRTRRTTQGGISPEQEYLLSKIYSMFPHFRISHMLDSEASLRSFLHALHTEEKEAWAGIPEDVNSTIVESIFEGQCSITISCNECSHCLVDYEEFCYLSLTAPLSSDSTEAADGADDKVDEINGPISLENCLKLYTDPEPWFCEKCAKAEGPKIDEEGQANKNQQKDDDMKVSVGATRRVLISAPPTVLALHLKRFSQSKRLEEGHVHYKEDLHIGPFVDPRSGVDDHVTYRLVGVLLHKETTTGGHYIANVRADRLIQRGSIVFWYNAIDGQVKKTSFESFEGEPHLLFYQKVMPENVSEEDMSVVKKANKNKQLEVTGKEIHGKGSVPDMIESHDEKVMPENVSEEDMGVVKKANKNKQWEVTGKEVHGKGSVPDMIESHDEQCLTNASQSSPNLTQEGTQLADIRMGEKSQLADINMQLQTGASVSDLSRPPLDEVLPWDYQRTRNPSRKARNKIAQDDDIVGQKIGFFLDRYILNGDRKPYYHFELVTMCERGSGSQQLNIHYSHLLEFSKDVAMDVCNGYTRLVPVLKETAIRFAQKLLTDPDLNLTVTARERMQQLASAKSASSLELNFLEMPKVHKRLRNCLQPPLTRRMQVYGSMPKVIRIPLPEKCALVQRLLAHVISGHRAGFSWDGDFSIDDVEAYDDRVLIAKEPKPFPIHPTISLEMIRAMEKDFARIASVVKKFKCSDSRVSIPYLKAFLTMLSGMREYAGWWSDSAAAEALRELIEHHPFLKPAMARSNLWTGIFSACRAYDAGDDTPIFRKVLANLDQLGDLWIGARQLEDNRMLRGVFRFKDQKSAEEGPTETDPSAKEPTTADPAAEELSTADPVDEESTAADLVEEEPEESVADVYSGYYEENYEHLFEFMRHLCHHGSAYTFQFRPLNQRDDRPRKQLMQSLDETELAGATILEEHVVKALAALLLNSAMIGLLKTVWDCYKLCNYLNR